MKPHDYTDVILKLEEKFADRNLKLENLGGTHPLQGSGELDGLLLYFRFRYDYASLSLGVLDEEFHRIADHNSNVQGRRMHKQALAALEAGEPNASIDLAWAELFMGKSMRDNSYPDRKLFYASSGPIIGEDYAGDLDPEKFYEVFVDLSRKLEPLAEEYQIRYPEMLVEDE